MIEPGLEPGLPSLSSAHFPLKVSPKYSSYHSQLSRQMYSFLPTLTYLAPLPHVAEIKLNLHLPDGWTVDTQIRLLAGLV